MPIATPVLSTEIETKLKVAISGGGPAGLAAAIALRKIPGVEVTIYEQARELREIGAGLRVGFNSWRVLELLGVDHNVHGHKKIVHEHRDGTTGELQWLYPPHYGPDKYFEIRAKRTVLQKALRDALPEDIVKLRKRLLSLDQLPKGGVKLSFEDGTTAEVDLVIGADGIRSAVRKATYPTYETQYNGTIIWRTLVPLSVVQHLDLVKSTCFHHGPNTTFKCSLVSNPEEVAAGKGEWEMTLRYREDPTKVTEKKFSWGIPATNERVASHFTAFTPQIQEAISLVPEGQWREFSAFSGSCLEHVTANDNTLLIGDASHPMLGAFGSGAAFAMQDGWLYAQALDYYLQERALNPRDAVIASLKLFDEIRGPYYHRMYKYMAGPNVDLSGKYSTQSPDPAAPLYWVFGHDIGEEWSKVRAELE